MDIKDLENENRKLEEMYIQAKMDKDTMYLQALDLQQDFDYYECIVKMVRKELGLDENAGAIEIMNELENLKGGR